VDDRGVGGSTGNIDNSSTADFATDVQTGIDFLKAHKEIDARRIGLIGHSEGGIVAPMVAAQSKDVAFIVMLAGPGLPGGEILIMQTRLLMKALKASDAEIDRQTKLQTMVYGWLNKEADHEVAKKRIVEEYAQWKAAATDAERKRLEEREATELKGMLAGSGTKWFRYFVSHDPRPSLRKVQCPVLALIGAKDTQVPPKENLEEITKALKEGGNKDFTVKEMPDLNHLFQTCKTGSLAEYASIEETVAPAVLEMVADWILARAKKR
jgi:pimeloyl-ACP methyl ester carboxylesterase